MHAELISRNGGTWNYSCHVSVSISVTIAPFEFLSHRFNSLNLNYWWKENISRLNLDGLTIWNVSLYLNFWTCVWIWYGDFNGISSQTPQISLSTFIFFATLRETSAFDHTFATLLSTMTLILYHHASILRYHRARLFELCIAEKLSTSAP